MDCFSISYSYLVNHVVPGPQSASYFAPFIFLPIALLIPPSVLSQQASCIIFLPIIAASLVHAWLAMGAVDVISVNGLFWSIYLIGIKDPRVEFTRLVKRQQEQRPSEVSITSGKVAEKHTDSDHPSTSSQILAYDEIPYPQQLSDRLCWVGALLISIRLTDWRINDPAHDRRQPSAPSGQTHLQFITNALLRSLTGFILLDLTAFLIALDPYFHDLSFSFSASPPSPFSDLNPFYTAPITTHAFRTSLVATQAWALISQQYHAPMVLPVILHYLGLLPDTWSPHLWAPYFGPATSMLDRGLRGFWSTYWHQTMRFVTSGPAPLVLRALDWVSGGWVGRRRWVRYTVVTVTAFGVSGWVHMGLVPRAPTYSLVGAGWLRVLVGGFFWLQPVGIAVEQLVEGMIERWMSRGFRTSRLGAVARKAVYAAWIFVWACVCFPLLAEAGRHLGYFRGYTVPWSLLHYLKDGKGVMWECLKS